MNLVISAETIQRLKKKYIPPISEFDPDCVFAGLYHARLFPRKLKMEKLTGLSKLLIPTMKPKRLDAGALSQKRIRFLLIDHIWPS
jgi:hypothetical protein